MGEAVEVDASPGGDLRTRYDAHRADGPVAREPGGWVVLGHAEVVAAATDPETFSSAVTGRRAIPNSLDGAEHAAYRALVDRYLTPARVAAEEAQCRAHAAALVDGLPRGRTVRTITELGVPYAVRSQSTWLGWPSELEGVLVGWIADNHAATRSGDRERTREVAERFDAIVRDLLDQRRASPRADVTTELTRDLVGDEPLTDDEIVSVLRNWTAGDLGSIAASVGVLVHHLAADAEVQRSLRDLVRSHDSPGLEAAVEELLRIDDPFVSNRRLATRDVTLGGLPIREGDRLVLCWTAANRDPLVFGDPDRFDPVANAGANLVFGAGPHICPGRALTLMELRVVLEELLSRTEWIDPAPDRPAVREAAPQGGWAKVPVRLR